MPVVTILHNPRCSNSRGAVDACSLAGVELDIVRYLDEPLSLDALRELLAILQDPPSALVRRDPLFRELGLREEDVQTAEQVAAVIAEHPSLMQRPVLQRGGSAIIGRPPERVAAFLA
ncbi:MAG: ArsC/Spx/MgsR family protein [Dermatophilaceae bacterium]